MDALGHLISQWLDWDKDPATRAEIEQLQASENVEELEKRLRNRIQFGTAGLRGRMAAGFSCMNSLTVIQASQGLAKYLKNRHLDIASAGVVIGHDARHNSSRFAALAANAFIAEQIPVWYYESFSPTPLVAFGVTHFRAAAGIMITASHNPSQDNGYKVYFKNGAQINTPMDAEIARSIEEYLAPWPHAWDNLKLGQYLNSDAYAAVLSQYKEAVWDSTRSNLCAWPPTSFVYTPLHGVGGLVFQDVCRSAGIFQNLTPVPDQAEPNPDFPTVSFPNPEEFGALDLAIQTADRKGKTLIIAHDPDADRFAAAEKVDGSWFTFTGNQIGVLLASNVFETLNTGDGKPPIAVLSSAVSTGMLEKMALSKGCYFEETLTGFKWMGNIARKLEDSGLNVPFAFEEALGYMFPSVCHDKDGITAAMMFLAGEARWRADGYTPYSKLQQLYKEYGHHETLNTYFRSPSPELTGVLFERIRNGPFMKQMSLGGHKISRWRDMTEGYDSGTLDSKPALPVDKGSQMLTLWLDRDVRFTLRGSGTEPKVKIYIESCGTSCDKAVHAVSDTFSAVLKEWILPFAPAMEYSRHLSTSSGRIFKVD